MKGVASLIATVKNLEKQDKSFKMATLTVTGETMDALIKYCLIYDNVCVYLLNFSQSLEMCLG